EKDRRRHALHLDLHGGGQSMLQETRKVCDALERQFGPDTSLPRLARDASHGSREAPVPKPRETIEAQTRRLTWAGSSQRRRGELRDDPHMTIGDDGRQAISLEDYRTHLQGCHVAEPPRDWRPN